MSALELSLARLHAKQKAAAAAAAVDITDLRPVNHSNHRAPPPPDPWLQRPSTAPPRPTTAPAGMRSRASVSAAAAARDRYTQPEALMQLLKPRGLNPPAVRLVRSSWLERRYEAMTRARTDAERRALALPDRRTLEATVCARGDLELRAFMTAEEVMEGAGRRRARCNFDSNNTEWTPSIIVLSACSLQDAKGGKHPDPRGQQLLRFMEMIEEQRRRGYFPSNAPGDYPVFLPWCSVYQPDEPEASIAEEDEEVAEVEEVEAVAPPPAAEPVMTWASAPSVAWGAPATPPAAAAAAAVPQPYALPDLDIIYAHRFCRLVVLDVPVGPLSTKQPRSSRAWPLLELSIHTFVRHALHGITKVPPPLFVVGCRPHVPPIRSAKAFAAALSSLSVPSAGGLDGGKKEREQLCSLYSSVLERMIVGAEHLEFGGPLGWGDEEVKSLSEVLPRFAQLKSVNLRRNERISEAGVNTLVKSLLTPGAAPRLNEVNLQLTGAAAVAERLYAITEAMKKRPTLWYV